MFSQTVTHTLQIGTKLCDRTKQTTQAFHQLTGHQIGRVHLQPPHLLQSLLSHGGGGAILYGMQHFLLLEVVTRGGMIYTDFWMC